MQAPSLPVHLDPSIDAGLVTSLERQHLAAHKVGGVMAPAQTLIRGRVLDASRDAVAERSDPAKPRDGDRDKGDRDGGDEHSDRGRADGTGVGDERDGGDQD